MNCYQYGALGHCLALWPRLLSFDSDLFCVLGAYKYCKLSVRMLAFRNA